MYPAFRFCVAGQLLLAAAFSCGCAATQSKSKLPAPLSDESKAQALASFESQRDTAQLQAALNRWQEGNPAACERALANLVQKRPDFVEARVQYAELLISRDYLSAAEFQLREALRLSPDRADAHHSLAIVLESASKPAEAAEHFRRAAELEPENPVYALAVDGA